MDNYFVGAKLGLIPYLYICICNRYLCFCISYVALYYRFCCTITPFGWQGWHKAQDACWRCRTGSCRGPAQDAAYRADSSPV